MTRPSGGLNPTSYAILGLLNLRSWTTYELTQQMQRALGRFWPRAESGIYTVPKALVRDGLAEAREESVGARKRTRFSITPAGREALRQWSGPPNPGPSVEFGELVRLFFAEHASRDEILQLLDGVRAGVEARMLETVDISRGYLEGRGGFPERLPWLILCGTFLSDFEAMVDKWAQWAQSVVTEWPDDVTQAEPDYDALRAMDEINQRYAARARSRVATQEGSQVPNNPTSTDTPTR